MRYQRYFLVTEFEGRTVNKDYFMEMREYDFYSRVEFSDTYQSVNKNGTKHLRFFRVVFRRHISQMGL